MKILTESDERAHHVQDVGLGHWHVRDQGKEEAREGNDNESRIHFLRVEALG